MTDRQPPERTPEVDIEERANGDLILTCPIPPRVVSENVVDILLDRAAQHPDRTLIAEHDGSDNNDGGDWQHLSYGDAVQGARRVAQWLLSQGASTERPLAILSDRSRQHFLMSWGAMLAGVPCCPISVPYSTIPGAFPKLAWVLETVRPAFIYAEDPAIHQAAVAAIDPESEAGSVLASAHFVAGETTPIPERWTTGFGDVIATEPTAEVDEAIARINDDTITRYIFTSGSTGMPKGVIQNHGMHRAFLGAMTAFDEPEDADGDTETRVLDWMPWSHTAAGVMRANLMLHKGGSIYLDTGRPVPGRFDPTIANLATVKPTTYSGSPAGWAMLVEALEADDDLAATFFANASSFGFGAAAMPNSLAERLQRLAVRHQGEPILLTTSLLSTEVSVGVMRWWPTDDHRVLGLPAPGAELKLVPLGDGRYEIRPRGPGVTPGYLNNPAATAAAFDDEGWFRMGDAVRFVDPEAPHLGLTFAGRVTEDFKLLSGTWVQAGALRSQVVAAGSPYIRDAVICGLNKDDVTALIWLNEAKCQALDPDTNPSRSSAVRAAITQGLADHNKANGASSTRIARCLILDDPPDMSRNEVTEKGYVNQRAVQDNRSAQVERLYQDNPDPAVIVV